MKTRVLGFVLLFVATLRASAATLILLYGPNQLVRIDSSTPGTLETNASITGLVGGDTIAAIDFRPATGVLYGLGIRDLGGNTNDHGHIYTLDPVTGAAQLVNATAFSTTLSATTNYGFDFDPVTDRIRVVSGDKKNIRVDPDTGVGQADSDLTIAAGSLEIDAIAYDRNDTNPGTPTTLFGINYASDMLVKIGGFDGGPPQGSPNGGIVTNIGPLNDTANSTEMGFDINVGGVAYLALRTGSFFRLFTVNLSTGAVTLIGTIDNGMEVIRGLAVQPSSPPGIITNTTTGETYKFSIQAAINDPATTTGHTLEVGSGTYTELVTVNKSLTLRGAKSGVDARDASRGTGESIVNGMLFGVTRFKVTANGVTIDGFTIEQLVESSGFGAGIVLDAGTSGSSILNNVIKNNIAGVYLANGGAKAPTVIERNLFTTNNRAGSHSGNGIFSDELITGGTLLNVFINDNTFAGNNAAAVNLFADGPQSRVVISNNIMTGNGSGVRLVKTTDSIVTRNAITGSVAEQIALNGGVNGVAVTENFIEDGAARGIRISNLVGSPNANIAVNCNSIKGNALAGLEIAGGSYTANLDASGNWWGSATGPTIASNPGGTGQQIVDPGAKANYSGFLSARNDRQPAAPGFQCDPSATLYGVDDSNKLLRFDSAAPGTILSSAPITGLQGGDSILGIDFRPTTGELFALGTGNRLYVIAPATAVATLRAALTATSGDDNPFTTLSGAGFGVGFNPVADLAGDPSLRVISRSSDQNLRINVTNGKVITDTNVNPAALAIDAVAYTNVDLDPATGTSVVGYDFSADNFVQTSAPINGTYNVVGASGLVSSISVNLDIQTVSGTRNVPFCSLQTSGSPAKLYVVNPANGLMTPLGVIGKDVTLSRGLAVAPTAVFQFSAPTYSVGEAGPTASIAVSRAGGSEGPASVRFKTQNGTATAPGDYTAVDQVLTFTSGQANVSIKIANDLLDEPNETINLSLSNPLNGATLGPLVSAVLTIIDNDKVTPVLSTQPSPSSSVGEAIFDVATISGGSSPIGTITFKLFGPNDDACSGTPIFTSSIPVNGNGNYVSSSFTPTAPGTYNWVVTYSGDAEHNAAVTSACGTSNQTVVGPATVLGNISTRLRVETGDNALFAGFIITGPQPKKVIVRGIGTSLPLADKLANPTLELRDSMGALVDANDNWVESPDKQAIIDSTIPPTNDLESAIVAILPANTSAYTAILRGVNGGTGIGVVEAYDLDRLADSEFANISTRGFVSTGDNVLIAGTIVVGNSSQKVIIRAIGPSLSLQGKMANPILELRDGNGALVDANDNWKDSPNKQAIIDSTIPPTNALESAIVATLAGNNSGYTAIVRGVGGTTGIAVVEVYALP